MGLSAWPVTIVVASLDGVVGATKTWTSQTIGLFYVRVDAQGRTHFDEPLPRQPSTCELYQLVNAPTSTTGP